MSQKVNSKNQKNKNFFLKEKTKMNHIIGLDIGIGSIGWSVINIDKRRIEDCGVRIFETGEDKDRKSNCQNRRGARGIRRVLRRKS